MNSNEDFINSMMKADELVDHEDNCGHCYHQIIMAEVAREIHASGNFDDAIQRWSEEATKRWQESKYFKLYQLEQEAGRDPAKAFEARGWEM